MNNRHCFEALNRSMRDIIREPSEDPAPEIFGGTVVVLGGDFRQVLLVVPKGSRSDIVNVAINSSYLWDHCEAGDSASDVEKTKEFADLILHIGDGVAGGKDDGKATISFLDDVLITDYENPIIFRVESTYPSILQGMSDPRFFQDRVVFAPTNNTVDTINYHVMSMMPVMWWSI